MQNCGTEDEAMTRAMNVGGFPRDMSDTTASNLDIIDDGDGDHNPDNHNYHSSFSGNVALGSAEEDNEPASKRPRTMATLSPTTSTTSMSLPSRERNKYKGMRIRQCLCGLPDCLPRLKGWIDLNDSKRQGFKELPRQSSKTTPVGLQKNRLRDIMFLHLRGHRSPIYDEADKTNRERKLFVAFHHFHPALLQDGNKGPYQYVSLELAEWIGGFAECDTVQNLAGTTVLYHPIPNYPRELADHDLEVSGGVAQQRYARNLSSSTSISPSLSSRTSSINASNKSMEKSESVATRNRVRDVLVQMEHDPLKVANDYIEMQSRLQGYEEKMAAEERRQQSQLNHEDYEQQDLLIEDSMRSESCTATGVVIDV